MFENAIEEAPTIEPSAERPITKDTQCQEKNDHSGEVKAQIKSADRQNYNLETIADIVKQLGHLDDYVVDICDRPRGEWIEVYDFVHLAWECSKCGAITSVMTPFCYECGADMRKDGDK